MAWHDKVAHAETCFAVEGGGASPVSSAAAMSSSHCSAVKKPSTVKIGGSKC